MQRPTVIAVARALNGLFFVAVSAYCLLAYSPFAYDVFIQPGVVPALSDFIAVSQWLFCATLLTTILTLMPQLSASRWTRHGLNRSMDAGRGRRAAWWYVAAGLLAAIAVLAWPPLTTVGKNTGTLVLSLAALVWPVSLAAIDHVIWPPPAIRSADPRRAMMACILAAVVACGVYAAAVPLRMGQMTGIDLPPGVLAAAVASSLVLHLFVFVALFLAMMTMTGVSRLVRGDASVEYWLLVALLLVCSTLVLYLLVCASLTFRGSAALAGSLGLSVAIAAIWANLARLRGQEPTAVCRETDVGGGPEAVSTRAIDSIALFAGPVAGVRSRAPAVGVLVALPFVAYVLVDGVRQFDWSFLLQKLGVLIVWLLAFASAYAVVGERRPRGSLSIRLAAVSIAVLALYHALGWMNVEAAMDRYAAVDPSLRLIRDARAGRSSETAEYYAFLRSHTLLAAGRQIQQPEIDFVRPLRPADGRKPHIFLIVVDSLRPDYLSAYNPQVTFTPEIEKLAADSFVFERALTRYSGTALSVPAIWTGGMVPHMVPQREFGRRNTLLKLLDQNGYRRLMDMDSVVETLELRGGSFLQLNPGKSMTMDNDFCTTITALASALPRDRARPTFFYSLPQNVHVGVAAKRAVPAGETYPSVFYDRVASSVHRLDACVGGFVDLLKRENLYDDSVIVLTADHGDLLGEEGRWGHAFWMYPEVMSIPLIVRVPSWLKPRFRTELDAVVFSTDIAPSLYALLGYAPQDLGPLFGRSLFTPRDRASHHRRREAFLLASSYGAVYGAVGQNGRRLYVVDTVDGTEYAFDTSALPHRLVVTPPMIATNRRLIEQQLDALATVYRYQP
jgi:hypothetical protein